MEGKGGNRLLLGSLLGEKVAAEAADETLILGRVFCTYAVMDKM